MRKLINQLLTKIIQKNKLIYIKFIYILYSYDKINKSIILRTSLSIFLLIKYYFKKNIIHIQEIKQNNSDEILSQLELYDIISFDVFDTLVFRPFTHPTHLFKLITKSRIFLYKRERAEKTLSLLTKKIPNIFEIYNYIEAEPSNEIIAELELCYANPIMKDIYNKLKKMGKKIIVTSDIYLPKDIMKQLLVNCGYTDLADLYISCDLNMSKSNGSLFEYIRKLYGDNKSIIHIGDNYFSDVINAQKHNLHALHYENINLLALYNNPVVNNDLFYSIQHSLINMLKYSGVTYSKYFIFGYTFLGIYLGTITYKLLNKSQKYNVFHIQDKSSFILNVIYKYLDNINIHDNIEKHTTKIFIYDYELSNNKFDKLSICLCENKLESDMLNKMCKDKEIINGIDCFMKTHFHVFKKHKIFDLIPKKFLKQTIQHYNYITQD